MTTSDYKEPTATELKVVEQRAKVRTLKDALQAQLNALDKAINTNESLVIEQAGKLIKRTAVIVKIETEELSKAIDAANEEALDA